MFNRSLLAVVGLLSFTNTVLAQNSIIRGKVRANDGATVNNAIVELKESSGAVVEQILTKTDGDFTFTRLGPGEYEIRVTMAGYRTARESVQIRGSFRPNSTVGEVVSVEISLDPNTELVAPAGVSFVQDVPTPARAAYDKGIAKIREGKLEEGIVFLREATAKYNDYFDAHFALGAGYYRLGKDAEALESLERARQINDRGPAVYYTFGMVMMRQQKFRTAEYAFGKAAELDDKHVGAHFNHAVCLIEVALQTKEKKQAQDILTQADRELDRSWELSGKHLNNVYFQRARICQERGDREGAARELEAYLKAEPGVKNAAAIKEAIRKLHEKR
jgi:Carboxypeptidase regulatory-like domain/Tetratricopeptide repeat